MILFLVDAQLPPKLAVFLREAGYQAEHVSDVGLRDGADSEIWAYAIKVGAVIVTKDEDFVERARHRSDGPVIVWLRVGNTSNRALMAWFIPVLPILSERIDAGERLIEIR